MRSLSTSFVALLPVLSLLVVGSRDLRRDVARGLRARARGRSVHRFVLVDLRRRADPRVVEGARAAVPGARRARAGASPASPPRGSAMAASPVAARPSPSTASTSGVDDDAASARRIGVPGPPAGPRARSSPAPASSAAGSASSAATGARCRTRRSRPQVEPPAVAWRCGRHVLVAGARARHPRLAQAGDRLPGHHAAARRARRVRGRRSTRWPRRSPTSRSTRCIGIEARGFVFAAPRRVPAAAPGSCPVRKAGKLPWEIEREEYELEYGTDLLEIHRDAVAAGRAGARSSTT